MLKLIIEYDATMFDDQFIESLSQKLAQIVALHFIHQSETVKVILEKGAGLAIFVNYTAHTIGAWYGYDPARDEQCAEQIGDLLQDRYAAAITHAIDMVPVFIAPDDMRVAHPVQINIVFDQ